MSIRKFAHPNLCTLGGVVCKLLQVFLQGIQLLGEPPGFRGKPWRKGSWESNNRSRVLKKLFLYHHVTLEAASFGERKDRLPFFFSGNITVNEHKPASINDVQWQHTNFSGKGRLSSLSAGQAMLTDSQASLFLCRPLGPPEEAKHFYLSESTFLFWFFFLSKQPWMRDLQLQQAHVERARSVCKGIGRQRG